MGVTPTVPVNMTWIIFVSSLLFNVLISRLGCVPLQGNHAGYVELVGLKIRDIQLPVAAGFAADAKSDNDQNHDQTPVSENQPRDTKKHVEEMAEQDLRQIDAEKRQTGTTTILSNVQMYNADGTSFTMAVQTMCVNAHNFVRTKHSTTGSVTWDPTLAAACGTYAATLATTGVLVHSSGPYGENLYVGTNSYGAQSSCAQAVKAWYSESYSGPYNYTNNAFISSAGHFTQVVWGASRNIGCGEATFTWSQSGMPMIRTVVVCRYTNQGNVQGSFIPNVKPPANGDKVFVVPKVSYLVKGTNTTCVGFAPRNTCVMYQTKFCSIVKADCECQCP